MSRYARFNQIKDGVAFSDPLYGPEIWCQYRKDFSDTNWFMKLDTSPGWYDSLCLQMTFGCPTVMNFVKGDVTDEGITVSFPQHYKSDHIELGIDSAHIFCGSLGEFNHFGEAAAFHTGGDGMFGDLFVFSVKGDYAPAGFVLVCDVDPEFVTEDEFFNQLLSSFEGKEINKEAFLAGISPNNLGNKILLSNEIRRSNEATENNNIERAHTPQER